MNNKKEEQDLKISKFNAGVSELLRLDELFKEFHRNRNSGNLIGANIALDGIWCELGGDLTSESEELKRFSKLKELIVKYKRQPKILNQVLMAKFIFLKQLQNKQGKGTAYADKEEDYM